PAKTFMGDTGSMFLGGSVVALGLSTNRFVLILIAGIIYIMDALSVVIQVAYFKATKGKRLFKMSPIHHHFELSGWSENKIVIVFSLVTLIGGLIAVALSFGY
ncbi:MAG: phospho-N-acetylmuramoyl-pentapeptide-transferase, partial [Oscillospiraceae bacterium]